MNKTEDILKDIDASEDQELLCRREFFIGLKKWSQIVIGGTVMGVTGASALSMNGCAKNRSTAWANGGGGSAARGGNKSWVNRRGGKRR